MKPNKYRSWFEIDLDAIIENYHAAKNSMPVGTDIAVVVKDNAYGLGAVPIAKALKGEGCGMFCVATMEEAVELRENGITERILSLSPLPLQPEMVAAAVEQNIETLVISAEHAEQVSTLAAAHGGKAMVHIKLDIGLSRLGIVIDHRFEETKQEIKQIFSFPGLEIKALMSHCTSGMGPEGHALNRQELERFRLMTEALEQDGYRFEKHCLASNSYMNHSEYSFDYVRLGQVLYGTLPGEDIPFPIKPVVSLYSRILQVKELEPNTPVSYGPEAYTKRKSRIATVGLGFADGLRRSVIRKGCMLYQGRKVSYIGKVCSDYATLDVTDLPDCTPGECMVVFGYSGEAFQGVEAYAEAYPGSAAEVMASFTERLPRFYLKTK